MKIAKKMLYCLCLVFSYSSFAQINATSMIKTYHCNNLSCILDLAKNSGYSFERVRETEMNKITSFFSDKKYSPDNNDIVEVTNVLTFSQSKTSNENRTIGVKFVNKHFEEQVLLSYKNLGFEKVHSKTSTDNKLFVFYESKKYPTIMLMEIIANESGGSYNWTTYYVGISTKE